MICLPERQRVVQLLDEAMLAGARQKPACAVLGLSVRTLQRWQEHDTVPGDARLSRQFEPANKLSQAERDALLGLANSAEFGHLPPSQIVPRLADRGEYVASESTFYRVLRAHHQLAHRHANRVARKRATPRALCATQANRLYSWDITYLPTRVRGAFFYLYLFLDLFSRKIVGWQVYEEESSELAAELIRDICREENIAPGQVVLHSDNGAPMTGSTMLGTLQGLGVVPSYSRPAVSNDNPFSESLFKTLKYRPAYPDSAFTCLEEARTWVTQFVHWYNHEHRHSAIKFVTPALRHAGMDVALLDERHALYQTAKARHPHRWTGKTRNWDPVTIVHLNPENQEKDKPSKTD